ncbi:hypothetical protein [Streptomyces sp. NPDC055006]
MAELFQDGAQLAAADLGMGQCGAGRLLSSYRRQLRQPDLQRGRSRGAVNIAQTPATAP